MSVTRIDPNSIVICQNHQIFAWLSVMHGWTWIYDDGRIPNWGISALFTRPLYTQWRNLLLHTRQLFLQFQFNHFPFWHDHHGSTTKAHKTKSHLYHKDYATRVSFPHNLYIPHFTSPEPHILGMWLKIKNGCIITDTIRKFCSLCLLELYVLAMSIILSGRIRLLTCESVHSWQIL